MLLTTCCLLLTLATPEYIFEPCKFLSSGSSFPGQQRFSEVSGPCLWSDIMIMYNYIILFDLFKSISGGKKCLQEPGRSLCVDSLVYEKQRLTVIHEQQFKHSQPIWEYSSGFPKYFSKTKFTELVLFLSWTQSAPAKGASVLLFIKNWVLYHQDLYTLTFLGLLPWKLP